MTTDPVEISLRPLLLSDAQMIFDWRNEREIVRLSSSQKTVNWAEHQAWIRDSIHNLHRLVFIIYRNLTPLGQVRFDRETAASNTAEISIYLMGDFTGKGYGIESMRLGCQAAFSEWPELEKIYAFVRQDNLASCKAFLKAGFNAVAGADSQRPDHTTFSLSR